MTSTLIELQKAVYTRLHDDTTLMGMVNGVFDSVPQGTNFPYVAFGAVKTKDWSTIGTSGVQVMLEVQAWSRERGRAECANILQRVHDLIHRANLTVTGRTLVDIYFTESEIRQENDGLTFRGVITFRANLQES